MQLSIIIPHYNSIESLFNLVKTIPNINDIEILIIDDNSDIDFFILVEKIKKLNYINLSVIQNTSVNKGAGACRNIGIKKAKGKWILFADSDDFFMKGFYSVISMYFNSNMDIIFFEPTSWDTNSNSISNRHITYKKILNKYKLQSSASAELSLRYKFLVPWSKLIRLDFIKKHGIYFDEVIASNDVMFSTKVGHYMEKFSVSNEIIYCVTKNVGSLTLNTNESVFDSRIHVYIDYCNFLKKNLNKEHLKEFTFRGTGYIYTAIKNKYGFKKIVKLVSLFEKNNIKIFDVKYFNLVYLTKTIFKQIRNHLNNNNYYKNIDL